MSATRIGLMQLRFAKAISLGPGSNRSIAGEQELAKNVDFDLF